MNPCKHINIVGGGLAGLTLGVALRRQHVPVTVWEAGTYPRHRVCGEFISGRGLDTLTRLGLRERLLEAGATEAFTATFFLGRLASPNLRLPTPALCISRYVLDDLLATLFKAMGGELQLGQRWNGDFAEGVVRATGRRPKATEDGVHWFGLKIHARGVRLAADLEIHAAADGYVGLCRLPGGEVNVCGLFRRFAADHHSATCARCRLQGAPRTPLHERMISASLDEESFCSIGGLALCPRSARAQQDCSIGDALTMIPPVTGNGMSMAFEAAELAVEPLVAFSHGQSTWTQARDNIAQRCDALFACRLSWARFVNWAIFNPLFRGRFGQLLLHSGSLWRQLFERTR